MDIILNSKIWCQLIFFLMFSISTETVKAEPDKCYPWKKVYTKLLPSKGGLEWNTLMLSDNDKWKYLIFSQKLIEKPHEASWLIVNPYNEDKPEINCVISTGKGLVRLKSLHNTNPSSKFGMPGSGYPRCGGKMGSKSNPLGSLGVRMWASKELGSSSILHFSEIDNQGFTTLLSDVGDYWILLKDNKDGSSCYYDRGKGYKLRAIKLKQK